MAYSGSFHPMTPAREENPPLPETQAPTEARRTPDRRAPLDLDSIFKKIEAVGMETDDLLMALILYLMYRESGDKDLLIMLGAMLLT